MLMDQETIGDRRAAADEMPGAYLDDSWCEIRTVP
jgi:hypothetical protein